MAPTAVGAGILAHALLGDVLVFNVMLQHQCFIELFFVASLSVVT